MRFFKDSAGEHHLHVRIGRLLVLAGQLLPLFSHLGRHRRHAGNHGERADEIFIAHLAFGELGHELVEADPRLARLRLERGGPSLARLLNNLVEAGGNRVGQRLRLALTDACALQYLGNLFDGFGLGRLAHQDRPHAGQRTLALALVGNAPADLRGNLLAAMLAVNDRRVSHVFSVFGHTLLDLGHLRLSRPHTRLDAFGHLVDVLLDELVGVEDNAVRRQARQHGKDADRLTNACRSSAHRAHHGSRSGVLAGRRKIGRQLQPDAKVQRSRRDLLAVKFQDAPLCCVHAILSQPCFRFFGRAL